MGTQHHTAETARGFIAALPHCGALGLEVVALAPGRVEIALPATAPGGRCARTLAVHGAGLAGLLDTAAGAAVMAHPEAGGVPATLGLRLDHLRAPAPGRRLIARAECMRVEGELAFARAEAFEEGQDAPLALAMGSFAVPSAAPREAGAPPAPEPEPEPRLSAPPAHAQGAALAASLPEARALGMQFVLEGGALQAVLPFHPTLIGNPALAALHGGAIAGFLQATALGTLAHARPDGAGRLPRPVDLSVDYLRAGQACTAHARATIIRAGRRYASVQVEAWQTSPARPFAQARAHFLMPVLMPGADG